MLRVHLVLAVVALSLSGAPAQAQTPREWPSYPIAQAPADWRQAVQNADLTISTIQAAVLMELRSDLQRGGPALAIKSCHLDAAGAASRAAREQGIAAGMTSDRLRNPTNAPRAWAVSIVKRSAGQPAAAVDGYAVDLGDRIGVLRPIVHGPMCTACHGPADKLNRQVQAELKDRYPVDRATGFKDGELRGFYWAEVPKQ
jgi:uncharacterized protein DUF3365